MCMYLHTKFQVSSVILMCFRQRVILQNNENLRRKTYHVYINSIVMVSSKVSLNTKIEEDDFLMKFDLGRN